MKLIDKPTSKQELKKMNVTLLGGLVKAVVDIKKEIIIIDAAMHADEERYLLDLGSNQDDLWGINFYPNLAGDDFIEFDSMINLRPRMNNFSRSVDDENIRNKIKAIVNKLIKK
ncbi:hypothetical protein AUK04_00705 [Candidatus Roizmanbacteria bacterium CG2_30_33_16]|uniref:Uncharacterized protein n=4 Tax=Candidatus Roizmaniibacteriota TaxID=1752723 RepID=A0A1J5HMN5_9BACT|nr:MAG: hypothetical protein AUK04_00705 [Candidatus Roizmanbacteria bacterium CG2_30_33_16]